MPSSNQINNQRIDELHSEIIDYFEAETDITPIIPGIKQTVHNLIDDKFIEQGNPKWNKILPLRSGQILSDSGQLGASVQVEIVPDGKGWKIETSEKFYGEYQEKGAKIRVTKKSKKFFWSKYYSTGNPIWKNMALTKKKFFNLPARPHLELTEDDLKEIALTIQELLSK